MGNMSRVDRANRFLETFNDRYIEINGLGEGKKFTVESESLGQVDGSFGVAHFVTLLDQTTGVRYTLRREEDLFDPDQTPDIEHLSETLDWDEDKVEDMLRDADLLRED